MPPPRSQGISHTHSVRLLTSIGPPIRTDFRHDRTPFADSHWCLAAMSLPFLIRPKEFPMTVVQLPPRSTQRETTSKLKDIILARKVARAISATGYAWLDTIDVHAQDGVVTLSGEVHSLFLREAARDAAQNVPDVYTTECQLRIV
ncbi:MAG: BON domain-containing protein [Planctomycetaceae bacterium]